MLQPIFEVTRLVTGRNEVVAKAMFLHVSVILSTGGGLQAGRTPPRQGGTPPEGEPPGLGGTPPDQADPPQLGGTPPGQAGRTPSQARQGEPPPGKQTPEYGLRAAGTHPTGMHSGLFRNLSNLV